MIYIHSMKCMYIFQSKAIKKIKYKLIKYGNNDVLRAQVAKQMIISI